MKLSPHNCVRVNIFTFLNFTKSGLYSDTTLEGPLIKSPFLNVCILEIGIKLADTFLDCGNI